MKRRIYVFVPVVLIAVSLGVVPHTSFAQSLSSALGAGHLDGLTKLANCQRPIMGHRERLIADRLDAKLAVSPTLTPQERSIWQADIEALRKVDYAHPYTAPDPKNPQQKVTHSLLETASRLPPQGEASGAASLRELLFRFFQCAPRCRERDVVQRAVIHDAEIELMIVAVQVDVLPTHRVSAIFRLAQHGEGRFSTRPKLEHHRAAVCARIGALKARAATHRDKTQRCHSYYDRSLPMIRSHSCSPLFLLVPFLQQCFAETRLFRGRDVSSSGKSSVTVPPHQNFGTLRVAFCTCAWCARLAAAFLASVIFWAS